MATPAQARLVFGAFDLTSDRPADLRELLRVVDRRGAADDRRASRRAPSRARPRCRPPTPARPSASARGGSRSPSASGRAVFERLGLEDRRPAGLRALPALAGDQLDPARTGGDLCVQACADDPQVAFHAVRNLLRIGRGMAELRWMQLGFGSNTATTTDEATPRNLMGFKDGTRNLRVDDDASMDRFVWVGAEEPQAWFRGGTYVVARRIRMLIEAWDRDSLGDQEAVIGRRKASGAPLSGTKEFDPPDLARSPAIPANAHIRLAAPSTNGGVRILRRGYAYTDGIDPRTGLLDAGLFFICFQRDPETGVRRDPAPARRDRRPRRVHPAHRRRPVRDAAGRAPRAVPRPGPARLAARPRRLRWRRRAPRAPRRGWATIVKI